MKGTIVNCMRELVCERFGTDKWSAVLERSGLEKDLRFMHSCDVEDRVIFQIIDNTCDVLDIGLADVADAFGDYWINVYAGKIYKSYFVHFTSFKDFVMGLNDIHSHVTTDTLNAQPPRFVITSTAPGILRIGYISKRRLIDFVAGLLRGACKHFNVDADIFVLSNKEIEVRFHV